MRRWGIFLIVVGVLLFIVGVHDCVIAQSRFESGTGEMVISLTGIAFMVDGGLLSRAASRRVTMYKSYPNCAERVRKETKVCR